ncbi:MAG: molecular chaperone DnaJ [bacterium]|nr:molecular chaperone DnaJ [bacterium]
MAEQDFYDVLGVARDADESTIKKAYRKLAMKYHPDRNAGDAAAEVRFREVNEAYEVLKDTQKRAAYDRFGHAAFDGSMGVGQGHDFASSFADVFDDLFGNFGGGGRRRRGGGMQGADLRHDMEITLEEAFSGKQADVRVPTSVSCQACGGSGAQDPDATTSCGTCSGYGKVRTQQGFFSIERTCPACGGAGRVIRDPCTACSGSGRVHRESTLSVTIPPGIEDGMRIRLSGKGEAGVRGGPPGDLYIIVSIEPHPFFQREGGTVYCRVPISITSAALGRDVDIPTIEGTRARIAIPPGTQTGRQFRLRGKGMKEVRGSHRGDMIIETVVETPVNLNSRQKELLREFDAAGHSGRHNPETEGFFSRVRDFWQNLTD